MCTPHHPTSQVTLGLNINLIHQSPRLPLANLVASFPYGGLMLPECCALCKECISFIFSNFNHSLPMSRHLADAHPPCHGQYNFFSFLSNQLPPLIHDTWSM